MSKRDFKEMTLPEKGFVVMNSGKHLTQIKQDDYLLNLYSLDNFFVEVYYSLKNDKIDKIEVLSDLSRIDIYIEESCKNEKLHLN